MLNTLNYSEITQSFMSFVSSKPKWYFDFKNKYYSFDDNKDFLLHNSNLLYNKMSSYTYPSRSFVKLIINDNYVSTKVFDNVMYSGDNLDSMLSYHKFYTTTQESSPITSLLIDKREDSYKFAIPRNIKSGKFVDGVEIPISPGSFADRLRGKYLSAEYSFQNNEGNRFVLPFIETTYRHSMI